MAREMTEAQAGLARHALGLPNRMRRSYRNRFLAGGPAEISAWDDMVTNGDAERGDDAAHGMRWFWLTRQGAEKALKRGERLCPEDFPAGRAALAKDGEGRG